MNKTKKKLTVSIGIAAYNSEENITHLIEALLKQKNADFTLQEIIIHSDASLDNTVAIAKSFKSKIIRVIDNKNRKGFAGSVKTLLSQKNRSDITILLNDDIKIKDSMLINKLIQPFSKENNIGLVCGHPQPLPPESFIERAMVSSFRAYDKMRLFINNGDSEYSCDGKILVLNKKFLDKFVFPKNLKDMGNVDVYFYFACKVKNFKFRFLKNAVVYYRNPTTLKDCMRWYIRNNSNKLLLRKEFGKIVDEEYYKPPFIFWRCLASEFIKNPIGSIFIFTLSIYISKQTKKYASNFNPTWDVIATSKKL